MIKKQLKSMILTIEMVDLRNAYFYVIFAVQVFSTSNTALRLLLMTLGRQQRRHSTVILYVLPVYLYDIIKKCLNMVNMQ